MTDIAVKPHFKTLWQTAIILNISSVSPSRAAAEKTIRRLIKMGKLEGACPFPGGRGIMVTVESIKEYLEKTKLPYLEETDEEIEQKVQEAMSVHRLGRRIISQGI